MKTTELSTFTFSLVNKAFNGLKNQLLPAACILCGRIANQTITIDLCQDCEIMLPRIENPCEQCGIALERTSHASQICGRCLKNPPPFTRTIAIFNYQEPIDMLITKIKFANNLVYSKVLGEVMAKEIVAKLPSQEYPDYIIPVPLHHQRLRARGYNQALELARPIAKKLHLPINYTHCERTRNTEPQTLIMASERVSNLKNAFCINKTPSKIQSINHVAIIDDVVTTGHTVTELSKVLKKFGVGKIQIWCCARTSQ